MTFLCPIPSRYLSLSVESSGMLLLVLDRTFWLQLCLAKEVFLLRQPSQVVMIRPHLFTYQHGFLGRCLPIFRLLRACLDYPCFESYDSVLITQTENCVGPTKNIVFRLICSPCCHHSNSVWDELQCRKLETPNWCFQFLSYITQWQNCNILDLVEPTAAVLSCQLRPV